jgi:thiol:disulfide interchange protein DsbC
MRKLFAVVFAVASMLCAVGYAADKPSATLSSIENEFKATFPKFTVESFNESQVRGLYEVTTGGNVFYYSPGGYLFFGEVYAKDGHSITQDRKTAMMAKKLSSIPLGKAFKMGNGKNVVIEITDPDCPYCRKASDFLSKRTDVTRYVFFFPLTQIHPNSERHATYILAENSPTAYEAVYAGQFDKKDGEAVAKGKLEAAAARLKEQVEIVGKLGVKGTPAFFVNGTFVNGANIPELEKLLKGEQHG